MFKTTCHYTWEVRYSSIDATTPCPNLSHLVRLLYIFFTTFDICFLMPMVWLNIPSPKTTSGVLPSLHTSTFLGFHTLLVDPMEDTWLVGRLLQNDELSQYPWRCDLQYEKRLRSTRLSVVCSHQLSLRLFLLSIPSVSFGLSSSAPVVLFSAVP